MADKPFHSLTTRLTRRVVAWSALAVLLLAGVQGWWTWRTTEARLQQTVEDHAASLAPQLAQAVWQISPDLLRPHLITAAKLSGIRYVGMYDPAGGVFDPKTGEVLVPKGQPWAEAGDLSAKGSASAQRFPIAFPPGHRTSTGREIKATLGYLVVVYDERAIQREALQAALWVMAQGVALSAVLLAVFVGLLRRHVQRPLRSLAAFLDELKAEQVEAPCRLDRPAAAHADELDRVAEGFERLQARVAEHVHTLDALVAQRTEALQSAHDTLKALAVTDALTGCHNRLSFTQRLPELLQHSQRYSRPLSVVFCDVDHFKSVNDRHGHGVGDRVLRAVGACLRDRLRGSSDWVARYGGEEFVVVLPETPLAEAQEAAERLRQAIAEDVRIDLPEQPAGLTVTASFGVAEWRPAEAWESLLDRADQCLYAAKRGGRNRVEPAVLPTTAGLATASP